MAKTIDWEAIEPHWRAGIKSVLQIAADYQELTGQSISHTAINKHFRTLGVPRDLDAKIRAKAQALVSATAVSAQVSTETTPSDARIIDANANIQATISLCHRTDVQRSRTLTMGLIAELEAQTANLDQLRDLAEIMAAPDERGQDKRKELFDKVISLQSRASTLKTLTDSLKTTIALEREAFGLDAKQDEGNAGIDAVIKRVAAKIG